MRRLRTPAMIDPRMPRVIESLVAEDQSIKTDWCTFVFANPSDSPPVGTRITISISGGYFYAKTDDDIADEMAATEVLRKEREKREFERKRAVRIRAEENNSRIWLPVTWNAGIKDNLSGLSEKSVGDGRKKTTVQHILVKEELTVGRLKREKNEFLCGGFGKQWSQQPDEFWTDEAGKEFTPEITCKECLRIAENISKRRE